MSPRTEEEIEALRDEIRIKVPSSWRLYSLIAVGTAIFGSAWQFGNDPAPDRWTGDDQQQYMVEHQRQHEREAIATALRFAPVETQVTSHEGRIDNHLGIQEHKGAARKMAEHDRRLDAVETDTSKALEDIHEHTSGTSGRVNRIETLEHRADEFERRLRKQ